MKMLLTSINGVVALVRRSPLLAAMVALQASVVAIPLNMLLNAPIYFGLVFVCVATFLVLLGLCHEEAKLEGRINAAEGGPRWAVWINGVRIGELTDASYAEIRRSAFFEARVHFAQLLNLLGSIHRILDWLLKTTPILLFWMVLGLLSYAPDVFSNLVSSLQAMSAWEVAAWLSANAGSITAFAALVIGFQATIGGSTFGVIDRFDQEIGETVRRVMGCQAEGSVTLRPAVGQSEGAIDERVHRGWR